MLLGLGMVDSPYSSSRRCACTGTLPAKSFSPPAWSWCRWLSADRRDVVDVDARPRPAPPRSAPPVPAARPGTNGSEEPLGTARSRISAVLKPVSRSTQPPPVCSSTPGIGTRIRSSARSAVDRDRLAAAPPSPASAGRSGERPRPQRQPDRERSEVQACSGSATTCACSTPLSHGWATMKSCCVDHVEPAPGGRSLLADLVETSPGRRSSAPLRRAR